MERNERIYLPPKRGRLYREHQPRGDRWLAVMLLAGASLWALAIWWWLS